MTYLLQIVIAVGQVILSFYGFWLVWRVLLPGLPGPPAPDDRIAPYARYFTDPFIDPVAQKLRVHPRWVSAGFLIVVAAGQVGLNHLSAIL